MYPISRLLGMILKAQRSDSLDHRTLSEITFRCRPWDLDMFMEMNNGRVLTLYDLGRFDLVLRIGMDKILRKNRWGLVVAGSTVRYRRRIRLFEKVTMRTRVAGVDARWVYLEQSMWVKGQPASSVLMRTGITAKGKAIDTGVFLAAMKTQASEVQLSDWQQAWIDSEAQRPWPPLA